MTATVYLHYTQEELNRNFDQREWVPNALEVIARYPEKSAATRARFEHRPDVPYGPGSDEVVDIFPAGGSGRPVQVFVHGGAWKNFTKDDYSFPADAFVPAGVHTVIVNFDNLPKVRLPDMVDKVRRAIEWVHRNAAGFGGDPRQLFVSAQSSGAHLAAAALGRIPGDLVKGATLVSGPYYLEPVVLSARSAYVQLAPAEVLELSPGLHAGRISCPVIIAYAEHDTDEFQRQSREYAAALDKAGRLGRLMRMAGVNHFELMESFGDPGHPLVHAIFDQMNIPRR
jgi:arylformamidase